MNKLYAFSEDFGRMGMIEYLGVMTEERMTKLIGKRVYMSDCLGKHSEVNIVFEDGDFVEKSDDKILIKKLLEIYTDGHISGHNLPEYAEIQEEEISYE